MDIHHFIDNSLMGYNTLHPKSASGIDASINHPTGITPNNNKCHRTLNIQSTITPTINSKYHHTSVITPKYLKS